MTQLLQNGGAIPQLGVTARGNRYVLLGGAVAAVLLIASTSVAHGELNAPGPQLKAFLPICATIWAFAELLTAFLLLSQFYVGGKVSFAIIAAGYLVTGLMTIPYLIFFPGVFFSEHLSTGDVQISVWLWVLWHLAFPTAMAAAHVLDPTLDSKSVPRSAIASTLGATIGYSILFVIFATAVTYFGRNLLPVIVTTTGRFTSAYKDFIPLVIAFNAVSLGIVLFRARKLSGFQMWLSIAILTMTLDAVVNLWAPSRFSAVWYVGKFEALLTSIVVLIALLFEVATLYRRLYDVAAIDTLTGLPNRRSFNDNLARTLDGREERATGVALLVIDVDNFKGYNDRYGHAAGDTALATVADAMSGSLVRSNDSVARFGGEEFVILLPDVLLDEVENIAERVRKRVAKLAILHEGSTAGYLTISIGAVFCSRHQKISPSALFDFADRALYAAKNGGRNCVVVRHIGENERERSGPIALVR